VSAHASKIDETKLQSAIMANFHAVLSQLYGYDGRPTHNIKYLNPSAAPKRLAEFQIGDLAGAWMSRSTGDHGDSVIDFVMWFGSCERAAAVELLQRLVDNIESEKAA
jgi:hypothetical protein